MAAQIANEHSHVDTLSAKPAIERLAARLFHCCKLRKLEKRSVGGENVAARTQAQSRLLEVLEASPAGGLSRFPRQFHMC
jgi:hypothetical protein